MYNIHISFLASPLPTSCPRRAGSWRFTTTTRCDIAVLSDALDDREIDLRALVKPSVLFWLGTSEKVVYSQPSLNHAS